MDKDEALRALMVAADDLRRHEVARGAFLRARDDALLAARAAGASWSEVQEAAGVTSGAVQGILRRVGG